MKPRLIIIISRVTIEEHIRGQFTMKAHQTLIKKMRIIFIENHFHWESFLFQATIDETNDTHSKHTKNKNKAFMLENKIETN